MAKFKSKLISLREQLHKLLQEPGIGLKVGRDLEKNGAQLARLPHRFHALQKTAKRIVSIFQAPEVSDKLMCFGGKAKIRSRAGNPILQRRGGGKAPKSGIQLHGIQLRGIEFEKFLLRQLFREKCRL